MILKKAETKKKPKKKSRKFFLMSQRENVKNILDGRYFGLKFLGHYVSVFPV